MCHNKLLSNEVLCICFYFCSQLEYATATGRSGKSCTDESQRWNKGTIQNLEAQRLENISFKRKRHPSTLGDCDIQPTGRDNLPDLPAPLTPEDFVKFVDTSSVSELFKLPRSIINAACIAEPLQFTVLPDLVHSEHSDQLFCEPCKKFFLDYIHVCDSQQCNLEKETKGQSTSVAWRDARRLRITGSSAKKVSVRATTTAENFLREQLYPSFRGNYATEHGRTSEPKTLQALKEMGFVISPKGTVVSVELSASPDGVTACGAIVEVKCPILQDKDVDFENTRLCDISFVEGKPELQCKGPRSYYMQVQVTMFCTGLRKCVFFVWTEHRHLLVDVVYDENYVHDVVHRLKCFYFASMLPRLADDFNGGRLKLTKRYEDIFSK